MTKILVVDDDDKSRELLEDFLENRGYNVITASSGKEALQKIRESPAIVLLDIMMPDMHGLKVLDEIKERAPSTEVIMVTSFDEHAVSVECMKRGAADFLIKPIDLKYLETLLNFKELQGLIKDKS